MLIESIIQRPGGSDVTLGTTTYHFRPRDGDMRQLAVVTLQADIDTLLAIPAAYRQAAAPTPATSSLILGTYGTSAALEEAFPAVSNKGGEAFVGNVRYISDGATWATGGGGLPAGYPADPANLGVSTAQAAAIAAVSAPAAYTWSAKPSASSVAVGTEIVITDVGTPRSKWYSDGTYWRPVNGRVLIKQWAGSWTTPAIHKTDATTHVLVPQPGGDAKIPAGMLIPGQSIIGMEGLWAHSGGTSFTPFNINLSVVGGSTFSYAYGQGTNANPGFLAYDFRLMVGADSKISSSSIVARNGFTSGGPQSDLPSSAINIAADMYQTFYVDLPQDNVLDCLGHSIWIMQ